MAKREGGDRRLVSEHNVGETGPPDTAENELPTEPEEQLQWLWVNPSNRQLCLSKKEGFRLLVFPSAEYRRSFLQHTEALRFELIPIV